MNRVQQSVAWWCFVPKLLSPEQFVQAVARIGYTAVDLVPAEHWQLVEEHGLAISSIGGHQSLGDGLNRRANHDRIAREIETNLRHAQDHGIANLICFSGNRHGLSDAEGADATAAGLAQVARAAEDAGVTLVLELLNSKVDHPDYQADHTAWGVRVCETVDSARVKLLYDIYHMQIMEGDLIRTIQAAQEQIGFYHTAGNPGRHELDDTQEIYYPAVLRAIAATGYSGYVAHEFIPTGEPIAALRHAFALCDAALSAR